MRPPSEALRKGKILARLLVVYLAFVLYLYLANWLNYLNLVTLPLGNLPSGSLLPLVLVAVVAVTLSSSKWRAKKVPGTSPPDSRRSE